MNTGHIMRWLPIAGGLIVAAGCASSPFDRPLGQLAQDDLGSVSGRERALLARVLAPPASPADTIELPANPTAEDYVQLALSRNPSLHAAAQRVRRLEERIAQVTSLADPMLQIAPFGEMADTAAGRVAAMATVSQRLPFPGRLDARGRLAAQDVAIAEQELEHTRLTVAANTRRAYWTLYEAAHSIAITHQNRILLVQMREVIQAKYRAGAASQESVLRVAVELGTLDKALLGLHQQRDSAAAMLNTLIDRPVNSSIPDPATIELTACSPRLDDLLNRARRSNPAIMIARARLVRFREQRQLAHLDRFPDLTLSATYNIVNKTGLSPVRNGDDQWWIGFGINLPIWHERLDAGEREAMRGVLEASGLVASEQNLVDFRVRDALLRVQSQFRQAALLRDTIVPNAKQTVEASLSGYRGGSVDFITLIDNWQTLLDLELMYQANLAHLERSFADLQEAVGQDLDRTSPDAATDEHPTPNAEDS